MDPNYPFDVESEEYALNVYMNAFRASMPEWVYIQVGHHIAPLLVNRLREMVPEAIIRRANELPLFSGNLNAYI